MVYRCVFNGQEDFDKSQLFDPYPLTMYGQMSDSPFRYGPLSYKTPYAYFEAFEQAGQVYYIPYSSCPLWATAHVHDIVEYHDAVHSRMAALEREELRDNEFPALEAYPHL